MGRLNAAAPAVGDDAATDAFDFELPPDRIAQAPVRPRDSARMLEVGAALADLGVRDLPSLLRDGDVLVVNDTQVIPARLRGRRRGAKVEITLHKAEAGGNWQAFARPARRLAENDVIVFAEAFEALVVSRGEGGEVELAFDQPERLFAALDRHGEMPLPPYISRPDGATGEDAGDYQTIYAARRGAVAAPTAGLHFTDALLQAVRAAGIRVATVTLHVGAGTFLPVRAARIAEHRMHSEWGEIGRDAAAAINEARRNGGRVISVGTTSLRLLETAADDNGVVRPFAGDTDLFITPGYRFRAVDKLMTNFHLPRSTLFMLVAAFAGLERMTTAYAHAVATGYRFYSYGDATFLHRAHDP